MKKEQLLALNAKGKHVDLQIYFDIQRFIHREAYWLNHELLDEWSHSLEDDLIYWIPLRENKLRRDKSPEISPFRVSMFEETKDSVLMRLCRNDSGMCWTEDPPTRQVMSVSNLEVFHTDKANEFEVHTVFTLYRSRFERDDSTIMGRRKDIWRKVGDEYRLAGRLVVLQQSTLLTKNLNVFM
jgi:ethylbenzene dioxygenase beta subunit